MRRPGRRRVLVLAALVDHAGAELVQLAEHRVDRVEHLIACAGHAGVGLAVIAGHPYGQVDVQQAELVVERGGEVADSEALFRDLVVGEHLTGHRPG